MKASNAWGAGLALALCTVLAAGCGSDSNDSSGTSTSKQETAATASGGFATAAKQAALYESERTGPEIPTLTKPAEPAKSIAVLTCPIPSCQQTTEGAVDAAKKLGWKVDYKTYELNPESYQKVVKEAAAKKPDAFVFISAFPNESIKASLAQLSAGGAAVVQIAPQAGEQPTKEVPSVLQGAPFYARGGEAAAYAILADAGKAANVTVVHDPAFGFAAATVNEFGKTVEKHCPDCGVDEVKVSLNLPAAQQLSQVTNHLRQKPDVSYLFFPLSDQAAGLPQALAAAGLTDKVKYVTQTASLTDLKQVKEGVQLATIQNENFSCGYRAVDAALRIMQDGDAGIERYPDGYTRILTQANVQPGKLPTTPGTPGDFLTAWGVS